MTDQSQITVEAPSRRALAKATGIALLVALICFSRIYLGVHYLSDVIAGFLAGVVWLGASLFAVAALR